MLQGTQVLEQVMKSITIIFAIWQSKDVEWLKRSLVGVVPPKVDYTDIKSKLLWNGKNLIRFRFWGATQAVKTFNTHEAMTDAWESEFLDWKTIFEKLREWICTDRASDRFARVNISGLPSAAWNKDYISSVLTNQGKIIEYDLSSISHN